MMRFGGILLFWALLAGFLSAQQMSDPTTLAPPPSGLSDNYDVLGKDSEAQARMIRLLKALENDHGYRLYVLLERSFISTTPPDLASQLQQAWVPEGDGLVIVFEADTKRLGVGRELSPDSGMIPGEIGVPAYELVEIISKSLQNADAADNPEVYIENIVTDVAARLSAYFKKKEKPSDPGRSLRLALVTIGALSLLALGGMGVGWLLGKADKKQSESRIFPESQQPERLGASYGGGSGSSHYFGITDGK